VLTILEGSNFCISDERGDIAASLSDRLDTLARRQAG